MPHHHWDAWTEDHDTTLTPRQRAAEQDTRPA